MPEEAVKQRLRYEKEKAKHELIDDGYQVIESDNKIICLSAIRAPFFERKIRIAMDKIEPNDIEIMKKFTPLSNQTREIWCGLKGIQKFKKIEIKNNKIVIICDPCQ